MRINPETVDRIKHAADIVEVVGDFVSLKKKGANYSACCPFHNEKTPSFNVNPSRQIYKCFGCGAAGDSIKFVMDIDGIGYGEALRYLANKYNIEIQEEELTDEETIRQNERESLYIILNFAKNFYKDQLDNSDEGRAVGLSYFRERGFSAEIRKKFELGYSLDTWDAFSKEALEKGYSAEILEKAGLLIPSKEGSRPAERQAIGYDRFRGRVIFPIHHVSGKVIAFGARILKSANSQKGAHQPKYLNSPETDVYHKSEVLYGIFQAKNAIRHQDHCYLVEGYTDVISLHQAGIENVVASSGTSLTIEQIRLIGRFTPNVTILYDGDIAGIKAALRGLDLVLEEGLNVNIVLFPDGDDPDSFVRKVGAEAFKLHLKQASRDFISFKTEILLQDAGNDPFKQAAVIGEVVNSIVKIPDAIKRQVFFHRTSEMMKVDEQMLITEGNKLLRKLHSQKPQDRKSRPDVASPDGPNDLDALIGDGFQENMEVPADLFAPERDLAEAPQRSKLHYQEEAFVKLLVAYGTKELEPTITVCQYVLGQIDGIDFKDPVFQHMLTLFREHFNRGQVLPTDYFLQHREFEIRNLAIEWVTPKHELSELWAEKYEIYVPFETDVLDKTAFSNILRLKKAFVEEKMKVCLQQAIESKSEKEQEMIMTEFMHYKSISMAAAKELGSVIG
jgi:DNA primase